MININKYIKRYEKAVVDGLKESLNILEQDIDAKTPVDTGEYEAGNKSTGVRKDGDLIYGKVYNDSDYADKVEYGRRVDPVNWHKNRRSGGPVIHRGVGARTYTRAFDENISKIQKILRDKLKKG